MTEVKTKPISFRVSTDVLATLEAAGLSATDIARAALEREAAKARRLAALARIRGRKDKFELGFDVVEFIRKDRDTHG
ncbi:MAG TPA: hypothetical protein VNX21_06385 [Candidatus Thermoplasmatota archaeon]|nr:hypothetical protein [Candidatus Thermoplasmatota archaeon]